MDFFAKTFQELKKEELYEILKSRTAVFLLEQNIICQDLDGKDYDALHCFFKEGKEISAYLRAFLTDDKSVMIGRVLTLKRGAGLGRELMQKSIGEIKKHFDCKKIVVDAQSHAAAFYEKMGFGAVSGEFIKEGVCHIKMELEI